METKKLKVDIHITTCHHDSVKCRARSGLTPWTPIDRLSISKTSIESIKQFVKPWRSRYDINLTLIDDGSNLALAKEWMNSLEEINVKSFDHRGSAYGINDHMENIDADLVVHIEDDHVMFNPEKLDWIRICYDILSSQRAKENNVGVITFRSGLPSTKNNPGYTGAWGPHAFLAANNHEIVESTHYGLLLFNMMGNAHHIMLGSTYKRMLPLSGNAGDCEAFMNNKLKKHGLKNAELQTHVYAFHSHTWEKPLPLNPTTDDLNLSGAGVEYGIFDMDQHFKNKKAIQATIVIAMNSIICKHYHGDYHYDKND